MDEKESQWPMPWIRACLDLAILGALAGEPLHGYAIAERMAEVGMGRLKGGSLYPVLAKLEQAGFIEATWLPGESGPGRKAYRLTSSGKEEHIRLQASWRALGDALVDLRRTPGGHDEHDTH